MLILNAYLDTCIVSGLAKEDLSSDELESLQQILKERKKGKVSLVTSPVAKEELDKIPKEKYRFKHETIYNLLSDVPVVKEFQWLSRGPMGMGMGMSMGPVGGKRLDPLFDKLINLLPDEADARHLFQAAKNNVQYFITTDNKTILSYREQIEALCKVKVVNPQEFIEILGRVKVKDA